jgi:hypothetical protein
MNIWKKDMDEGELREMVEELSENMPFQYQIIVTFGDCNFENFDVRKIPDFDKIVSGRIFGADAEFCFRRISDTIFRTVVISECELSNLDGVETKDLESSNENKSYYLWGEKLKNEKAWFEARIPRLLPYPLDNPKDLVKLKTIEYKNRENGLIEFIRFQDIVGEDY